MVELRLRDLPRPAVWVTGHLLVALAGCEEADPPPAEIWSCSCHFDLLQARPPAMGVEASDWVCGPAGWGGTTARLEAARIAERGCAAGEGASNCECTCEPLGEVCDEGVL